MARKSRKAVIQAALSGQPLPVEETTELKQAVWDTAGYVRLSVMETRDRKDSMALSNQKELLCQYIAGKPDLKLRGLYADNGETGTNFPRSEFQRLMADIQAGKINCVVVKDLSRFGRNAVEAGDYLERVFPFLGVRFISVSDGYDSTAPNAGDALRNLLNEAYSMDISRKSGSVLREKQKRGEFIGAYALYGYLRDPSDVHRIIIDPETAPVVREIFHRAAGGEAVRSILRWLNTTGILSPCTYRYQKGICKDKRFADGKPKPWTQETLKEMLKNPVYLGHMVQGRRRSELYAGRPDRSLPPSEWTVVENTHEPIIDQATFDRVQELRRAGKEKYEANIGKYDHLGSEENIFRGLIFCADCGCTMVRYKSVTCEGKKLSYRYICYNYANLVERSGCSYKYLPDEDLKDTLGRLIAQEAALAVNAEALLKKKQSKAVSATDLELSRARSEQESLSMLRDRLMRDLLSGILSKEDHDRMKQRYTQEAQALEERIAQLQNEQRREKELPTAKNPWLAAFRKHTGKVKLSRDLVQALVERVTVYAQNRIEVQFKYRDERAVLLEKYIRLSEQDGDCSPGEKAESNSVANQRCLLDNFIAAHPELGCHSLEFIDDGHTGTNFDRPGVQSLLAAVRRGEIDCIIVKDLSRFGRNSTEAGEYLEKIFPLLQVRFIAVNDGYDSMTKQYGAAGDLDVGIRNIMNEMYSRKVSQDVRTAKRQCAARGECIAAYPFYGYVKGTENRRRLEVDPPAADTVRMIYDLWLAGNSIQKIADTLNERQIPSPSARKRQLGAKRTNWSRLRENIPWNIHTVRVMLRNERYTGKLISLRVTRKEIGKTEVCPVPKEDWIVVEDAFEPIISNDVFQKAQAMFRSEGTPRRLAQHIRPVFYRKILCGVCGLGPYRQKAPRIYYRCKEKHGSCGSVRIYEDDLKAYVLTELQNRTAGLSAEAGQKNIAEEVTGDVESQINALEQKLEKHWSAKKDAFVKWNGGLISKAAYEGIYAEHHQEIQRLNMEVGTAEGYFNRGQADGKHIFRSTG